MPGQAELAGRKQEACGPSWSAVGEMLWGRAVGTPHLAQEPPLHHSPLSLSPHLWWSIPVESQHGKQTGKWWRKVPIGLWFLGKMGIVPSASCCVGHLGAATLLVTMSDWIRVAQIQQHPTLLTLFSIAYQLNKRTKKHFMFNECMLNSPPKKEKIVMSEFMSESPSWTYGQIRVTKLLSIKMKDNFGKQTLALLCWWR